MKRKFQNERNFSANYWLKASNNKLIANYKNGSEFVVISAGTEILIHISFFLIVDTNADCDVNCHKKCQKLMANLCGVNQKLIVEALSSVRRGTHLMYKFVLSLFLSVSLSLSICLMRETCLTFRSIPPDPSDCRDSIESSAATNHRHIS